MKRGELCRAECTVWCYLTMLIVHLARVDTIVGKGAPAGEKEKPKTPGEADTPEDPSMMGRMGRMEKQVDAIRDFWNNVALFTNHSSILTEKNVLKPHLHSLIIIFLSGMCSVKKKKKHSSSQSLV